MKGTVPCGSAHSDCQKKKKKNLPADPWKITLFRTKMSQAAPSRGFHLILLFRGLFLGLLPDEISDFLEKLARVMSRSRNDSRSFFFSLSSENVWKYFRGQQASRHHVKGQFRGRVASPAASTLPSFNRHVCHIVGKRGPERQEARQSGIYSIWERESTEIFKGSNVTRVKMNRNIGEKLK